MKLEQMVAANYARDGIVDAVLALAMRRRGSDPRMLTAVDLSGADELHIGGLSATLAFAASLRFAHDSRVLDLGCGIGGPARIFAEGMSVAVTGVDLLPDYVAAARELTRRVGLESRCEFVTASALSLPFCAATFEGAYMMALGMNVSEKAGLFHEARRVLKSGGRLGVCDPMLAGPGDVRYPLPWAMTSAGSFLEPLATYEALLKTAGFAIERVVDRSALAKRLFQRSARGGEGRPGIDLSALFGEATAERTANIASAVEAGVVAPVEIIARAV